MKDLMDKSRVRRTRGMVVQNKDNEETFLHTLHTHSHVCIHIYIYIYTDVIYIYISIDKQKRILSEVIDADPKRLKDRQMQRHPVAM